MVLVRRAVVGGVQPLAVRGHVRERLPREALEVLVEHRDAFGRAVGLLALHDVDPRVDAVERRGARAGGVDARVVAVIAGVGGGALLCASHRSSGRRPLVLLEQVAEERRAGAEDADDDERRLDALVGHLRVAAWPSR